MLVISDPSNVTTIWSPWVNLHHQPNYIAKMADIHFSESRTELETTRNSIDRKSHHGDANRSVMKESHTESKSVWQYSLDVAKTLDEARSLVEAGFDYVTDIDDVKLFRRRK